MIGFTLMEMIAVTVAIAILGSIAVVSYRSVYTKGLERAALASLVTFGKATNAIYTVRKLDNPGYLWSTAFSTAATDGIVFSLSEGDSANTGRAVTVHGVNKGNLPSYDEDGNVFISYASILEDVAIEVLNTKSLLLNAGITPGNLYGGAMRASNNTCVMIVGSESGILGQWTVDTDSENIACWGLGALQRYYSEANPSLNLSTVTYSTTRAGAPSSSMITIQENNGSLDTEGASIPNEDGESYTLRWNLGSGLVGDDESIRVYADADGAGPLEAQLVTCAGTSSTSLPGTTNSCNVSGLTAGSQYTFSVKVVDSDGQESTAVVLTDSTRPSSVTSCSYTMTPTTASLSWSAPSGSYIGFRVTQDGNPLSNTLYSAGTTTYTRTLSGLTTGNTYAIKITTYNAAWDASSSCNLTVTPIDAPAQVTGLVVSQPTADNKLTLSWDAQTSTAARPINGYRVYKYDTATGAYVQVYQTTDNTATLTFPDSDLGVEQSFVVAAYSSGVSQYNPGNTLGEGVRSEAVVGTPISKPASVSDVAVSAYSNGGVTLTWENNPTTGAPYSNVRIYNGSTLLKTVDGTATSATLTGLNPGQNYDFRVIPVNSTGEFTPTESDAGTGSTLAVVAVAIPDAPTGLSLAFTSSEGELNLEWSRVLSTTSKPVSGYRVFQKSLTGDDFTQIQQVLDPTKNYTISGLTLGESYTFRVSTYGQGGEGERSDSVSKLVIGAPTAPVRSTVTYAASGAVTLTYTIAPSASRPVDSFKTVATPDSGSAITRDGDINGTTSTVNFSANVLNPGESYSLVTKAINDFDTTSTNDSTVVSVDAPNATSSLQLSLTTTEGEVSLDWADVASTSAKPVTGYRVYKKVSDNFIQIAQLSPSEFSDSGNTLSTTQEYAISTYGTGGEGDRSPSSQIVVIGAPLAPVRSSVTYADNGAMNLTYTLDSSDERPIVSAEVLANDISRSIGLTDGVATFTANSLTSGTTYTMKTKVSNAFSTVTTNESSLTPVSVPSAPSGVAVAMTNTAGEAKVTWNEVTSTASNPVTGYRVFREISGTMVQIAQVTTLEHTAGNLLLGASHDFAVSSFGTAGEGSRFATVSVTTVGAPAAPTSLVLTPNSSSIEANWTAASSSITNPVTGYTATIKNTDTGGVVLSVNLTDVTNTFSSLSNGVGYTIEVVSRNSFANSSSTLTGTSTPFASPGTVATPSIALNGSGGLRLTWSAVSSTAEAPVTGYRISRSLTGADDSFTQVAQQSGTTFDDSNLTLGTRYYYRVAAYGPISQGGNSSTVDKVAIGAPTAPVMAANNPGYGDRSVILRWNAVTNTAANPVTGIEVLQGSTLLTATPLSASDTSYTISGLTAGTQYTFNVRTVNDLSNSSNTSTTATALTTPAAPTLYGENPSSASCYPAANFSCQQNNSVLAIWLPVSSTSAASVTGYRVFKDGIQIYEGDGSVTGSAIAYTVSGTNGTDMTVAVAAYGPGGEGARSEIVINPAVAPSAPTSVTLPAIGNAGNNSTGSITVTFGGASANGESISSYTAT